MNMNTSSSMEDMKDDMGGGGMMMMYFHACVESTILFKGWTTSTWAGMLGSCVVVFIMATLYEGLKVFREVLLRRTQNSSCQSMGQEPTSEATAFLRGSKKSLMCSIPHAIQTSLHGLQVLISYLLMLVFMTYNVYLCFAVILGACTGYYLFSWKRSTVIDANEHCH